MSGPVKRDAFIQNVTTSLPVPTNGPLLHVLTMVYIRIISKPKKNITPECLWIALAYLNISMFAPLFRLVFLTHTHTSVEKGREPYCTISDYLQLDIELLHISKTKKRKGRVSWSLMHFTKKRKHDRIAWHCENKTGMDEFRVEVQIIPRNNPALRQLLKIEQRLSRWSREVVGKDHERLQKTTKNRKRW